MGLLGSFLSSKPSIPKFTPIDPSKVQSDTVAGNVAVLPEAEKLASSVNSFNQAELDKLYESALPFYSQIKQKVGENILSDVSGNIPQSVMDNIMRASAGQAVYGGFGGSARQMNLTGGKFAQETFKRQETGMDAAQRWLQTATTPRMDVTSMFFSPTTRLQHAVGERDAQFQRDYAKSMNDASFSLGNRLASFDSALGSIYMPMLGRTLGGSSASKS